MKQNIADEAFDPLLPEGALRTSDGDYMEVGARLTTKDGRRLGNAYVDSIEHHPVLGRVALAVSDMGNVFRMTERELASAFYPPDYVLKLEEARNRRGVSEIQVFSEWWDEIGSGIVKLETEDSEEHAHRVAKAAWLFAKGGTARQA